MTRKALILAVLLSAAPAASLAQTLDVGHSQLEMTGTAPSACVISAPTSVSGINATMAVTSAQSAQVTITQLVDQTTAEPLAASIVLSLPIICNTAHTVTVTTANGGLARVSGNQRNSNVTNGFREFLPYQVDAVWAGRSVTGDSQTQPPVSIVVPNGAAGDLSLTVAVPAGGAPLIAGAYADSLVIQLQVAS